MKHFFFKFLKFLIAIFLYFSLNSPYAFSESKDTIQKTTTFSSLEILVVTQNADELLSPYKDQVLKQIYATYGSPIIEKTFPLINSEEESYAQVNKVVQKYDVYYRAHLLGLKIPSKPRLDGLYNLKFQAQINSAQLCQQLMSSGTIEVAIPNFYKKLQLDIKDPNFPTSFAEATLLFDYFGFSELYQLFSTFVSPSVVKPYFDEVRVILEAEIYPEGEVYVVKENDPEGYPFAGRRPVPFNSCEPNDYVNGDICVPGMLTIRYRNSMTSKDIIEYNKQYGFNISRRNKFSGAYHVYLPDSLSIEEALNKLSRDSKIWYAEPIYIPHIDATSSTAPNDLYYGSQWNITNTYFDEVWKNYTTGSSDIIIAVIDTGVTADYYGGAVNIGDFSYLTIDATDVYSDNWAWTTEEYDAYRVNVDAGIYPYDGIDNDGNGLPDDILGHDFCERDNVLNDDSEEGPHGTATASIIGGALTNNFFGIAGLLWDTSILPVKYLQTREGYSYCDHPERDGKIDHILEYISEKGARIANMSFGNYRYSRDYEEVLQAFDPTILMVNSAGNYGVNLNREDAPFMSFMPDWLYNHYPCEYDLVNIICVAAAKENGNLAGFSNFGDEIVHVAAPGKNVLAATDHLTVDEVDGTSFAAPHVTALAGALLSYDSALTLSTVRDCIFNGADGSKNTIYGHINAMDSFNDCFEGSTDYEEDAKIDMDCGCDLSAEKPGKNVFVLFGSFSILIFIVYLRLRKRAFN